MRGHVLPKYAVVMAGPYHIDMHKLQLKALEYTSRPFAPLLGPALGSLAENTMVQGCSQQFGSGPVIKVCMADSYRATPSIFFTHVC